MAITSSTNGSSAEPETLALTPGPTGVPKEVLEAVSRQTKNHTHPDFLRECRAVQLLLEKLLGTDWRNTGVFTSAGTGGNEAGVMNFVHPGDRAVYVNSGFFSGRVGWEMIRRRSPGEIIELETAPNDTIDPNRFEDALRQRGRGAVAAAYLAQIETSEGTQVPEDDLVALGSIATRYDVMLCIDSVCALGGTPIHVDRWQAAYVSACSQKGANATPGTAPFAVAPFALERIRERDERGQPPGSFYFDLPCNLRYWNDGTYHYTPAVQNIYALRKALEITLDRAGGNIQEVFQQHERNQRALDAGFAAIGLENRVLPEKRAAVVSVFDTPTGVDANDLRRKLLELREVRGRRIGGVEFAAGKRNPSGQVRVGLLGLWSTPDTVYDACDAVGQVLGGGEQALGAAAQYYREHPLTNGKM